MLFSGQWILDMVNWNNWNAPVTNQTHLVWFWQFSDVHCSIEFVRFNAHFQMSFRMEVCSMQWTDYCIHVIEHSWNIQKHQLYVSTRPSENRERALSINLKLIYILLPPPLMIFTHGPKHTRARSNEKCLICLFRILNHRFSSITYAKQFWSDSFCLEF